MMKTPQKEKKVVIVGIGNASWSDDGAGPAVALKMRAKQFRNTVVLNAGETPENFLGKITANRPAAVYLVDAADFGGRPGEVGLFKPDDLKTSGFSTHGASLYPVARYLEQSGCRVYVLAIQPEKMAAGSELSPAVVAGITKAVTLLEEVCTNQV